MDEKLKKIYELYNKKKYKEAKKLVDEILLSDPNNIYAKRYLWLLNPFLSKTYSKDKDWKIARIKWKKLTCPHCKSKIALSALNNQQKQDIRENNYHNLSLKCPYCNTIFTLQVNKLNSVLWIKIWDICNYKKKTYRVVWAVKYTWKWKEWWYSGNLNYLEWILLWSDNSYLYFSEWYFVDDWERNYEYEFSEKITPNFSFSANYDAWYIEINGKKVYFSEENNVKANKLYGENSKVFEVGEKVELFEFSYAWEDYVLEKEKVARQSEVWIYKTKSVSKRTAANYFWKKINILSWDDNQALIRIIVIWIFILPHLFDYFSWFTILWIIGVVFWIYFSYSILFSWNYSPKTKKIVLALFIWPVFATFIVYPIWNMIIDNKKEIQLENIWTWQKFEVNFQRSDLKSEIVTSTTRYDYWGVRTYYESKGWLKFSVKTEEDKKIVEKIKTFDKKTNIIYDIFHEKIYKLK